MGAIMLTKSREIIEKIYLQPIDKPKKIMDFKYNDGEHTWTWDFASLSNGNMIVIHNNVLSLYEDLSKPPIVTKVIDEKGFRSDRIYHMEFLHGRLFLTCSSHAIEVDIHTLATKMHANGGAESPVYLSESGVACLDTDGICWLISPEGKIRLNQNKESAIFSIKKISNENLVCLSKPRHSPDCKREESNSDDTTITLWSKIENQWTQVLSKPLELPQGRHKVLYPTADTMLILTMQPTETLVTPVDLKSFSVHKPWFFSCGFPEMTYFCNVTLADKDVNSTFDSRTIVFYKEDFEHVALHPNLYYLDLSTRSLRKLPIETNGQGITKICAILPSQIVVSINSSQHRLDGDIGILRLKIPNSLFSSASEMISSSTNIIQRGLKSIILDYADQDFPSLDPYQDLQQDPDEAKLHKLDDEAAKLQVEEAKLDKLRVDPPQKKLDELKQINQFLTLAVALQEKIVSGIKIEEHEYLSLLQQYEPIKDFAKSEHTEIVEGVKSFVTARYERQGRCWII